MSLIVMCQNCGAGVFVDSRVLHFCTAPDLATMQASREAVDRMTAPKGPVETWATKLAADLAKFKD